MQVSQKGQYALRAVFELACHYEAATPVVKISQIAQSQAIPVKFLEAILNELKHGGFVDSRRGSEGGYFLTVAPETLTVGQIIRFVEGPFEPVECRKGSGQAPCPLRGDCVFMPVWQAVEQALAKVYDGFTFRFLVNEESKKHRSKQVEYQI